MNIEKGRYIGTKDEDRICNLCKNNIEDEVHFLITCPLLEKFREPYIKNINKGNNKLPNSEQSYKGKVKTHNYINRQNQSTTGKL